ncbi:MAG: hypothetical protein C0404_01965 [Verrucomicrobia bacterium]|nr:hypothetical protein [Verrucomicrobiota bacterium]
MNIDTHVTKTPEQKCIWLRGSATGLPDVLELGRRHQSRQEPRLRPHRHGRDHLEISYLHKGRKQFTVGESKYLLRGGDVLIIAPGDLHGGIGRLEERGLLYWLILRVPSSKGNFLGFPPGQSGMLLRLLTRPRQRHFSGSRRLRNHLEGLLAATLRLKKDPMARFAAHAHLVLFLLELLECSVRQPKRELHWKDNILRRIEENIAEPLSISGLAAAARLSVSAFERRFKQETGFSPVDYILRRKIDMAKERLATTATSITTLAFDLGFSSSQYFATVFKRYTGLSPRQFRARRPADR